ncbi:hypothetical protein [Paenibacillus gorillae]|nr:hypothetical protein [Paenibacillus gorillae]
MGDIIDQAKTKDMISVKGCTERGVKAESLYCDRMVITPLQP